MEPLQKLARSEYLNAKRLFQNQKIFILGLQKQQHSCP